MQIDVIKYVIIIFLFAFIAPAHADIEEKIIVFVNEDIYDSLEFEINRYVEDISAFYSVNLFETSGGDAQNLKSSIIGLYSDSLIGCIFVGALPYEYFRIENDFNKGIYSIFPCDLFFMDLNGIWFDEDQDNIYDTHIDGDGDVNPEIFIARIDASSFTNEIDLLRNYFNKNHDYYSGNVTLIKKALAYTDDDWQNSTGLNNDLSILYGIENFTKINDNSVNRDDYLENRLKSDQYEYIQLACHSASLGHLFTRGGSLYSTTIQNAPLYALGYNLFACKACNFTHANYLCGSYIFNDSYKPMVVVGSTKSGSMQSFHAFYNPLSENKPVGTAFKEWFDYIAPFSNSERSWHYGMTIIGDPIIRFHSFCDTPDPPVANDVTVYLGESTPDLIAIGENIKWYDDRILSSLVHTGDTFTTGHTDIGTYTYYATQTISDCESNPDTVTLIIIPAPPVAEDVTVCEGEPIPDLTAIGENIKWYSALTNPLTDLHDSRDGQTYNTVAIGDQVWMAGNLNYYTSSGSWYYDNDSLANSETYGRLYNWETGFNSCPANWYLPDDNDWQELIDCLGGNDVAGGKIKEPGYDHWDSPNTGASNTSGFTALPAGKKDFEGGFHHLGYYTRFWSASQFHTEWGNTIEVRSNSAEISTNWIPIETAFSVRCIRDSIVLAGEGNSLTTGYESPGIYIYYVTQTISGEESSPDTVIFTIHEIPSEPTRNDITICEGDSIFAEGCYQTLTGIYYDTLSTVYGCDSVIITELTVHPAYETNHTAEICEGKNIFLGSALQTEPGIYYDTLPTVYGCDSVIITELTVHPAFEININEKICEGESIMLGSELQTISGTYYDTLPTIQGCDSIIITELIVNALPNVYLGNDTIITTNDTIVLDARGGYTNYLWSDGSNEQTITLDNLSVGDHEYFVIVTNNDNCTNSDTIVIQVILPNSLSVVYNSLDLEIFPNPTSDFLIIKSNTQNETEFIITLIDNSGKVVRERKIEKLETNNEIVLDLSNLNSGFYILRINNTDLIRIHKIIKN